MQILHSVSWLSAQDHKTAHETFRATCALGGHGGDPPDWASSPGSAPETWTAPSDAAGTLALWPDGGTDVRVSPPQRVDAPGEILELLNRAGWFGELHAVYRSSGGRLVALVSRWSAEHPAFGWGESETGWWILVLREGEPRGGATEQALLDADPEAQVYVLTRWQPE